MNAIAVLPFLLRRRAASADALPVIAFAAATAVIATVLGGTLAFARRAAALPAGLWDSADITAEQIHILTLPIFAALACVLLLPPALSLGGAAGRLSLARREQELATMRLIGATSGQVIGVALLDVTVQALLGGALGLLAHLALAVPLTALDFGTTRFTASELRLPLWALPVTALGIATLAVASAAIALQGVAVSPLGVARRSRPVRMSVLRLLLFVVVAGVFVLLAGPMSPFAATQDTGTAIIVLLVVMGVLLLLINVVGPFLVWITALLTARFAPSAEMMVGARRLAADPRAGWRSISVLTIALVIAGMFSLLASLGQQVEGDPDPMLTAMETGGFLTLAIAAVLGAVSTGVMQAARVIDQAPVLRAQHVAGATVSQLHRSRLVEIALPLLLSSAVAVPTALVLLTPVMSGDLLSLEVVGRFALSVTIAYGMVLGSVLVSSPLVALAARGSGGVRRVTA